VGVEPGVKRAPGAATPARLVAAVRSLRGTRADAAIIVAITLLAAGLRLWQLGTVPLGLHGDEAWTGLDARRILREGWIGPYVTSALGQPTGPLYLTALLFKVFPETTMTTRASMALFGIATVPLAYLAFSTMYSRTVGAFAAFALTVMTWHLHLSRTAFMVTAWPFAEMVVLWLLWLALRRRRLWLFAAAGAMHGLAIYTYNADLLFLPVPFVAMAWWYVAERAAWRRLLVGAATFAAAALVVATPMIVYVARHTDTYRFHERVVSVTNTQRWRDASVVGKGEILGRRAGEWLRGFAIGGRPDLGDGLATGYHPLVDPLTLLLAVIGLAMVLRHWRRPESGAVFAALLLFPWGALLTVDDGLFRRTFGLAPFVALLAALPLAWLWDGLCAMRDRTRPLYLAAFAGALALNAGWTAYQYFGPVQDTATMKFVYPYQMDAASRFIAGLPPGTYVLFYSDRWSFDYETRRFLAPNATGEDRSVEFSPLPGAPDFSLGGHSKVAFVLLGTYLNDADRVRELYPGGTESEGRRGGDVEFRAYVLSGP